MLNTPRLSSQSDLHNLSEEQRDRGVVIFKRMDFDRSASITLDEFEAIFADRPERAKELLDKLDRWHNALTCSCFDSFCVLGAAMVMVQSL